VFKAQQADIHRLLNSNKNGSLYVDYSDGKFISPSERITDELATLIQQLNAFFLRHPSHHLGLLLARVLREHLVDERLVADASATRLLAERLEDARIDANGDQLTGFFPDRRSAHAAHGRQLLRRRVGDIREINLSPRTPHARGGSPAAR
jgi:hypothetical protein